MHAAFHMAVASFPIIRPRAKRPQFRVRGIQPRRFHISYENRTLVTFGQIAGQDHAHLIGENFFAFIVDHAATIAVPVKPKREISAAFTHRVRHVMQHFHRFGVWVVMRECVIKRIMRCDHLDPHARE